MTILPSKFKSSEKNYTNPDQGEEGGRRREEGGSKLDFLVNICNYLIILLCFAK